ncbi:MAG: hypothetical protein V1790_02890 [Planctomycetota bacterium]
MLSKKRGTFAATLLTFSVLAQTTDAAVYWSQSEAASLAYVIKLVLVDGSNPVTVYSDPDHTIDFMFLDVAGRKLYFTVTGGGQNAIKRMDALGGNVDDLVALGSSIPVHLAGDPSRDKMYWHVANNVHRANLDGSGAQQILSVAGGNLKGLDVDHATGLIYMLVDSSGNTIIRRANSDGTSVQNVITVNDESPFIAGLAAGNGRLYWDNLSLEIRSVKVDGTDLNVVMTLTAADFVNQMSVDEAAAKLYWTAFGPGFGAVMRANTNGTGTHTTVHALTADDALSFVVSGGGNFGIPTVGTWGIVVLSLLITTAGTVVVSRRNRSMVAE